ncbi:AraC family transcriptional regulator [Bacillus thuringiensis serovar pingluonsis]|uniref:AraC family transcriptional regulator n=1 Tax=Bacillus thuringiensis serovar pingluonsis TaxID=180881 RepID=A0A243BIH5_BACTU|nr:MULTISPECIES: helix-turn-helix domain-containing protein [Bacillus cereus group]MEB9686071.1 helix-turn-helix domain-containing protein [Bacillus anthracis]OPD56236.1 AraC family transcriptional regulator [Bacillus anthracis]OTY46721.1 AraC family transcriptional regulator [Bacillus thuringiensis serovar pingluonsis]
MSVPIDLKHVCNLIHQAFSIPIHFFNTSNYILFKYNDNINLNPLYPCKEKYLINIYDKNMPDNYPILKTTPCLENFLFIRINNQKSIKGTLVIGPSIEKKISKDMVIQLVNIFDSNITVKEIITYFDSVPVLNKLLFIHIGLLLHYIIFNEKLDINTFLEKNKTLNKSSYPLLNPDIYISAKRQDHSNDYNITLEEQFFSAITEGNKEKLIKCAYSFPQENAGVLSKTNQLRNQKNNGIIAITLATRYAIKGNLPSEIAFSLSDLYIQKIEQTDNIYAVNRLIEEALCTFADSVKEYKEKQYSKKISMSLDYIARNIYNDITVNSLANYIQINPSYLSDIFKQEVGITLKQYIQKERIEEAKRILTLTQYPVSRICHMLNFHDQSYFIKVFKKFTTMTPKQYREKYTVI